jgi:hypothetical protein
VGIGSKREFSASKFNDTLQSRVWSILSVIKKSWLSLPSSLVPRSTQGIFFLFNANQNCTPTRSTFHCVVTIAANLSCTRIKYMSTKVLCISNIVHYWGVFNTDLYGVSRFDPTPISTQQQILFVLQIKEEANPVYTYNKQMARFHRCNTHFDFCVRQ